MCRAVITANKEKATPTRTQGVKRLWVTNRVAGLRFSQVHRLVCFYGYTQTFTIHKNHTRRMNEDIHADTHIYTHTHIHSPVKEYDILYKKGKYLTAVGFPSKRPNTSSCFMALKKKQLRFSTAERAKFSRYCSFFPSLNESKCDHTSAKTCMPSSLTQICNKPLPVQGFPSPINLDSPTQRACCQCVHAGLQLVSDVADL